MPRDSGLSVYSRESVSGVRRRRRGSVDPIATDRKEPDGVVRQQPRIHSAAPGIDC